MGAIRSMQGRRTLWFFLLSLFLVSPFLIRRFVPETPSICTLRNIAGIGCPGCGLTRSVCALSEGRIGAAIELHAFGPLVYLLGIVGWLYHLVALFRNHEPFRIEPRHVLRIWVGVVVAMIGYWIVRLILGAVP